MYYFSNMKQYSEQQEDLHQAKMSWLESHGYSINDVTGDDRGEYVLEEGENGMEKRYLDDVITQE